MTNNKNENIKLKIIDNKGNINYIAECDPINKDNESSVDIIVNLFKLGTEAKFELIKPLAKVTLSNRKYKRLIKRYTKYYNKIGKDKSSNIFNRIKVIIKNIKFSICI